MVRLARAIVEIWGASRDVVYMLLLNLILSKVVWNICSLKSQLVLFIVEIAIKRHNLHVHESRFIFAHQRRCATELT